MMVTHDSNIVDYFATQVWVVEHGELAEIRQNRPAVRMEGIHA